MENGLKGENVNEEKVVIGDKWSRAEDSVSLSLVVVCRLVEMEVFKKYLGDKIKIIRDKLGMGEIVKVRAVSRMTSIFIYLENVSIH